MELADKWGRRAATRVYEDQNTPLHWERGKTALLVKLALGKTYVAIFLIRKVKCQENDH